MLNKLPNIITAFRLFLSFVFLSLFLQETTYYLAALIIFSVAAITDAIDGWLARKFNIISKFGEHFDPLADKFLTIFAFVAFALRGIVEWWCVAIIIFRDILTTFIRYKSFTVNKIPTSKSAKLKTLVQLVFISFILLLQAISEYHSKDIINEILFSPFIYFVMIGITLLTVWTMIEYVIQLSKTKS